MYRFHKKNSSTSFTIIKVVKLSPSSQVARKFLIIPHTHVSSKSGYIVAFMLIKSSHFARISYYNRWRLVRLQLIFYLLCCYTSSSTECCILDPFPSCYFCFDFKWHTAKKIYFTVIKINIVNIFFPT